MLENIAEVIKKRAARFGINNLPKYEVHALYAHELVNDGCDEESAREIMKDSSQTIFIRQQLIDTFGYRAEAE